MNNKSGFTLMELLIVMTIAGILAGVSISGYIGTLRIERRQDAILSMQKAWLIIQSTGGAQAKCPTNSAITYGSTACPSSNGFYNIFYNNTTAGFVPTSFLNQLIEGELLVLQATTDGATNKGQDKDTTPTDCHIMYLSNQNKIYPRACSS